jgi:hypothetical protein
MLLGIISVHVYCTMWYVFVFLVSSSGPLVEEMAHNAHGLACLEHLVNFYLFFFLVHLHLQTHVYNIRLAVHSILVLLVSLLEYLIFTQRTKCWLLFYLP